MDASAYQPIPSSSRLSSSSSSSSSPSTTKKLIKSISTIPHSQLDTHTCSLLGPFSILIQAIMAFIILASLLYKRHREKPKRKYRIWTADVSKQVLGQAFVHMLNIFISDSMASLPSKGNPCALYFINIFIDTTIGVFVLFLALNSLTKLICKVLNRTPASLGLSSGIYPRPFLMSWIKQISIYFVGLLILKLFVLALFWLGGEALIKFGDGIIEGISLDPKVQILMVVMIGPTILNVLQFLLIDSFIKHKPNGPIEPFESDNGRRFLNDDDSDSESDDQDHDPDDDDDDDHENGRKPSGLPTRGDQDHVVRKKKDHQDPNSNRHQRSRLANPTNLHGSVADVPHSYPPRTSQPETRERNQSGYRLVLANQSLEPNKKILFPPIPSSSSSSSSSGTHGDDKSHLSQRSSPASFLKDPSPEANVQHPFLMNSNLASKPTTRVQHRPIPPTLVFDRNPNHTGDPSTRPILDDSDSVSNPYQFTHPELDRKPKDWNPTCSRNRPVSIVQPPAQTSPLGSSPTELKTGFSVLDLHPSSTTCPSPNPLHQHSFNPSIC